MGIQEMNKLLLKIKRIRVQNLALLIILVFLALGFCNDVGKSWRSGFHKVSIEYYDPMLLYNGIIDNKDSLLVLCYNPIENSGILLKIDRDLPIEQLPDETYYAGLKQTMLNPNQLNKLLYESDTLYHGTIYHSLVFYMKTPRGERKFHCNINRKDGFMYSVQIYYPCDSVNAMKIKIPENIINQDKMIKINE